MQLRTPQPSPAGGDVAIYEWIKVRYGTGIRDFGKFKAALTAASADTLPVGFATRVNPNLKTQTFFKPETRV